MCIVRGLGVLLVGPIIECAGESVDSRRLDEKMVWEVDVAWATETRMIYICRCLGKQLSIMRSGRWLVRAIAEIFIRCACRNMMCGAAGTSNFR